MLNNLLNQYLIPVAAFPFSAIFLDVITAWITGRRRCER